MSALVLRCQSEEGRVVLQGLNSSSTLSDLQQAIQLSTSVSVEEQKLKSGFPPKNVDLLDKTALLTALGFRSGDTVVVERGAPVPASSAPAPPPPSVKQGRGIVRKVVAANNSCLFASVGFLLQGDTSDSVTTALRYVVGNEIVCSPAEYPEVMLGKKPEEYAMWIQGGEVWGGGIELAVLSKYFNTEIHVVDTQSLRIDKFGQELKSSEKTYVIYDGIHYDPLYQESPRGPVTVFPVNDLQVEEAAMILAGNAKKAHNYTDLANFSLKCGTCGKGLTGENDARAHAKHTGHTNFQEFS